MNKDVLALAGGMALLLAGKKGAGLSMFAKGALSLEKEWRAKHPEVAPGFAARWEAAATFYEKTHQNSTNRFLHQVGIPMIVGGAVGLLAAKPFRPVWAASAVSFGVGWALNLVGHAVYEKSAPAFFDDPLSFIAGPIWDIQQMTKKKAEPTTEEAEIFNGPTNATA
jgi:hypothetical protein